MKLPARISQTDVHFLEHKRGGEMQTQPRLLKEAEIEQEQTVEARLIVCVCEHNSGRAEVVCEDSGVWRVFCKLMLRGNLAREGKSVNNGPFLIKIQIVFTFPSSTQRSNAGSKLLLAVTHNAFAVPESKN